MTGISLPKNLFLPVLAVAIAFVIGSLAGSCDRIAVFDQRPQQGVIEYKISFPTLEDDSGLMTSLLPEKMTMHFNRGVYATELSTVGGLFKNRFVVNGNERSMIHQIKIFKKKIESEYNETDILGQLNQMPRLTIIETGELDTIAGLPCRKAIGIFDHISMPEMTIYYTDAINIPNPNWCTQFHEIDGVLLQYDLEQMGIRMRFTAVSVQSLETDESSLAPEPGYDRVPVERLQAELEEVISTFNF